MFFKPVTYQSFDGNQCQSIFSCDSLSSCVGKDYHIQIANEIINSYNNRSNHEERNPNSSSSNSNNNTSSSDNNNSSNNNNNSNGNKIYNCNNMGYCNMV